MLFIFVANFGLMLIVVSRAVDLAANWNYLSTLNDVQFTFFILGTVICHLGVIFSFHTSRDNSSSSHSIKKNLQNQPKIISEVEIIW